MSSPAKTFVTQVPDASGESIREVNWSPKVTIGVLRRVREALGLDLIDDPALFDPEKKGQSSLAKMLADTALMVDVIWLSVERQAEGLKVTDEQFGESLAGDAISEALDAWLEAYVAFFPNPRRAYLEKAVAAARKVTARATAMTAEAMAEGGEIDQAIDRAIDAMFRPGSGSTKSPATSASIPSP